MTQLTVVFQPGVILYDSIIGAFRAGGGSLSAWCSENDVSQALAGAALFGTNRGPKGSALREKLIEAAGREMVTVSYRYRMQEEAQALSQVAA